MRRIAKSVLVSAALLLFASLAHAQVAKPKSTDETAKGTVKLMDVQFNYNVQDRGWFPNAAAEHPDTTKTFWFEYKSDKGTLPSQGALKSAILIDNAQKCAELGQSEYAGQLGPLAADLHPSLQTEVINSEFSVFEDGVIVARLVCQVHIEAK